MAVEIVRSVERMQARAGPILARLPAGKPTMVEVGTAGGLLAEYLLRKRRDLMLYCVDSWLGSMSQPAAYVASGDTHAALPQAQQDQIKMIAVKRLTSFGTRAAIVHRDSVEAAKTFPDEMFDLVFLDGDHSYEGVTADLEAWWPKVKPGAWMSGHDFANPDPRFNFGVDRAVFDWLEHKPLPAPILDEGLTWFVRKPV